jgi:type I restriction enzyme, S subunit
MKNGLPQGWVMPLLGDVVQIKQGNSKLTKKLYKPDGKYVAFSGSGPDGRVDEYEHEGKAIVLSAVGARCGKCFKADGQWAAIANTAVIRPLLADDAHYEYLFFLLNDEDFWPKGGTAQPFVQTGVAQRETTIPLPPLNEQRRIVAKLEKLLDKVDACQQRLTRIPVLLKRFRQSVLAAACSGRLTADWREQNPNLKPVSDAIERLRKATENVRVRRGVPDRVPVSDLVAEWQLPETWGCYSAAELLRVGAFVDVKDGNHGANHPKVSDFTETGLPFITAAQVNNYRIDYDGAYKLSGKPLDRIRVGFAKSGDVIYTHKGSVGRVAVADRGCVLTPQTTYYRVNPEVFVNGFLMLYLASQPFSGQVNVVKEQTTRDFVPISEQYMLFHRVPPLAEQQEIVRRVEALFALADQIEARYAKAKAYVEKLPQSILAKAFRGKLVPQDPSDEPASVLLEKIKQTKADDRQRETKRAAALYARLRSNRQFGATNRG